MILFGGEISGSNFNPAVSIGFYLDGKLPLSDLAPYIIAQILGTVAAKYFYDITIKQKNLEIKI